MTSVGERIIKGLEDLNASLKEIPPDKDVIEELSKKYKVTTLEKPNPPKPIKFNHHDSKLVIFCGDKSIYGSIKRILRSKGFSFGKDREIAKKYPSLAQTHHEGNKGDLKFIASIHPAMIEIEFYQDINFENKCGGKYDFNKLSKMTYLQRLTYFNVRNKIIKMLLKRGLIDGTKPRSEEAYKQVMNRRAETMEWHPQMYTRPIQDYNSKDKDGLHLKDGDVRYFYDYNGILSRGTVYYNINNMWWVVCNKYNYSNKASFDLFQWKPGMPIKIADRERKLQSLLKKLIEEHNYERAIIIRDLLGIKKKGNTHG